MSRSSVWPLLFRLCNNNFVAFLVSSVYATCLYCFILLSWVILIMFGGECKLWSCWLCIVVHCLLTPPFLGPDILITLFSNTLNLCSSSNVTDPLQEQIKFICLHCSGNCSYRGIIIFFCARFRPIRHILRLHKLFTHSVTCGYQKFCLLWGL